MMQRWLSGKTKILDQKKILYPVIPSDLTVDKLTVVQDFTDKVYYGMTEVLKRWHDSQRRFPVHFYGNKVNQGIAFSDLAIALAIVKFQGEKRFPDTEMLNLVNEIKDESIEHLQFRKGNSLFGLMNGESGSMWLLSLLGYKNIGKSFGANFDSYMNSVSSMRLYDGVAGILLTGVYFKSVNALSKHML